MGRKDGVATGKDNAPLMISSDRTDVFNVER